MNDFVYFNEQFEARMHSIKLGKVLSAEVTYLDLLQAVRNSSSEEHRRQAIEKGREELERRLCGTSSFRLLTKHQFFFSDHIRVMAQELGMYCVNASKVSRDLSYIN